MEKLIKDLTDRELLVALSDTEAQLRVFQGQMAALQAEAAKRIKEAKGETVEAVEVAEVSPE